MRKILLSLLTIAAVSAIGVAATRAFFSDKTTSPSNTFTTGTLDLVLDEAQSAGVTLDNMAPGNSSGEHCLTARNAGSLPGWLGVNSSYLEQDRSGAPDPDMSEVDFAKKLVITSFTADGVQMVSAIPDVDTDGVKTVYDMVNDPSGVNPPHQTDSWHSYDTNTIPSESHIYCATVQLDSNAGNDYQGDGIIWNFSFFLGQL